MKRNVKKRRYLEHRCDGKGGPDCASSGNNACAGCGRIVGDCWFYAAFDDRWDWVCVCGARGIIPGAAAAS